MVRGRDERTREARAPKVFVMYASRVHRTRMGAMRMGVMRVRES